MSDQWRLLPADIKNCMQSIEQCGRVYTDYRPIAVRGGILVALSQKWVGAEDEPVARRV